MNMMAPSFFISSSSNLQEMRTGITSRTTSTLGQIGWFIMEQKVVNTIAPSCLFVSSLNL